MQYISYKRMTVQMFDLKTGISNGAVAKMGDNTRRSTLDKISNKFPDLNTDWLLTGEGEMLRPSAVQTNQNGDNIHGQTVTVNKSEAEKFLDALATCHEIIRKKDEQIDKLLNMLNK